MADADAASAASDAILRTDLLPSLMLEQSRLAENKIVGLNARDSRSRAFNLLRTRLSKALPGSGATLIGVTSATPAAGKTFICANLALSLAKVSDGQVILVDLDLRRGSVAEELGLDPAAGVRDFLQGHCSLQEIGIGIEGLPLAVLPTNADLHESAELLSGSRFADLIGALRSQPSSTIVLFDLPPVFANDDAMLSIEYLDGYILVIDSSVTSKSHVRQAMSMLEPAPCVGTVLNRYRGSMLEKYGYGYGTGAYGKYYQS